MRIPQLWILHHRPVEQRDRTSRQQWSRSRERTPQRTPPHTPSQSGQQPQHVEPPPGEPQIQPLASQDTDEESKTVDPQSRVSNRSILLQSKDNPPNQKGMKTKSEMEKPNDLLVAKKHKSVDSDEDDEEPQDEPGTSSTSQPSVPVLLFESRTSSQFTGASCQRQLWWREQWEKRRVQCTKSGLWNDEHWTVTPETHKYALQPGHSVLCLRKTEKNRICNNLTTIPSALRSLCLEEVTDDSSSTLVELPDGVDNQTRNTLERCMATCGKAAGARAKIRSRARKEASAQEVRGHYKQLVRAKHPEWKSWIDNEVFDLVDLRKFEQKNYVTGRWVLTIKNDK